MACSCLKRATILHHRFNAIRIDCSWKTLPISLASLQNRHRHPSFCKVGVDLEHFHSLFNSFFTRGMSRMTFLPKKFRCPQKKSSPHFPPNNIRPLIDQQRQIAITLNPLCIRCTDDRFRSWSNNKWFFQFSSGNKFSIRSHLQPVMRDDRTFLCESIDMRSFLFQERHRNEQREIGVAMSSLFEHSIKNPLHIFPDRISPRLDDHATTHGRIFCQIRCAHYLLVPLGIVFRTRWGDRRRWVCHEPSISARRQKRCWGSRLLDALIHHLQHLSCSRRERTTRLFASRADRLRTQCESSFG